MTRTAFSSSSVSPRANITAAWLLDRTEALCRADTTTGREDHGLPALRGLLRELGARIELQEVEPGRHNVLAIWGTPRVLFSTHLDTVPPFLPPRRVGDTLHGRGACDAKGQVVAQLAAIQSLLAQGHGGFAWLGVVGEETDSVGAEAAIDFAPLLTTCRGVINGEPTENRLTTGQRGSLQLRLVTKGKAAHSGTPELGRSAIWPLLDWLQRLRELPQQVDPDLGTEIWNLGTLHGGQAPNVVPDGAEAMLFARTLPGSSFLDRVRELAPPEGAIADIAMTNPERFTRLPGFDHVPVTFGSDAPRMRRLVPGGQIAMCGPGSIKFAHTKDEHVTGGELLAGSELLVAVAETMLRERLVIVMKFGGTSVGSADRLQQAAALVVAARPRRPLVVLSAMAKTTDALFAAARAAGRGDADDALATAAPAFERASLAADELLADPRPVRARLAELRDEVEVLLRGTALLRELTTRTTDAIVAHGERIATALFTALLRERGHAAIEVDARTVLRTNDRFGQALPDRGAIRSLAARHLAPELAAGAFVVTQGYVGGTDQGYTTTLGRGGSDWSAALFGAALAADEVQIWTDVEGVLTADPRTVQNARPVPVLSPAEAAELAAFGAKVLHPATIQPALEAGIPVTVRHTAKPGGAFTTIDPKRRRAARGVAALASRGPVTVLTMTSTRMLATAGYLAKLFAAFGELDICVDLVVTAEVSVACTVEPEAPIDRLIQALDGLARVEVARDRAIVVAVGEGLRTAPQTVERACRALLPIAPELIGMGGNERNLSFVVHKDEVATAMQRPHAEFFGSGALAATGPAQAVEGGAA